jgi:mannitol/fructose-specific phosphotransferase system IIA component (Ntr-type)
MIDTKTSYLRPEDVHLDLRGATQGDILSELVASLGLEADAGAALLKGLLRREAMESTALGHGVAMPHCRSAALGGLRVVFGRQRHGAAWGATDGDPVRFVFLLVAPHVCADYLPLLARIARLANDAGVRRRLDALSDPAEFLPLLTDAGV